MIEIFINNEKILVKEGTSILEAARLVKIRIPTLCYLERVQAIGACRLCLVEVENNRNLVASCVTPVVNGMKIFTNTKRVREARKSILELILSEHDGNCQTCSRKEDCELKKLAAEIGVSEITFSGEKTFSFIDDSTPALVRDNQKCIKCRRCVSACNEVQGVGALYPQKRGFSTLIGPALAHNLTDVVCVQCGQCSAVCPVGALVEKDATAKVWEALDNPKKYVVVQTAPAVRASLGECLDYPAGTLVTGKMTAALKKLGFKGVFDTNFTADLTVIEETMEFLKRVKEAFQEKKASALPQFTSCSPGWIKFAEYFYPEYLANISTCKSPQQMFGALAKTYLAQKLGIKPEDTFVVSVMPCLAKKFEAARPEMCASGFQDVDAVLTTRELAQMIKQAGIDFKNLKDEEMDRPLGVSSGAADIFAATGGVMEAALRTAYEVITGRELPFNDLHIDVIAGLKGIKEAKLTLNDCLPEWSFLNGVTLKVAVVHGLGNVRLLLEKLKNKKADYHFIEIMTCPGGCVGGGGQPRPTTDEVRKKRIAAIYREDKNKKFRKAHSNPKIKQIYGEFLISPLSELSHKLLHTKYQSREVF